MANDLRKKTSKTPIILSPTSTTDSELSSILNKICPLDKQMSSIHGIRAYVSSGRGILPPLQKVPSPKQNQDSKFENGFYGIYNGDPGFINIGTARKMLLSKHAVTAKGKDSNNYSGSAYTPRQESGLKAKQNIDEGSLDGIKKTSSRLECRLNEIKNSRSSNADDVALRCGPANFKNIPALPKILSTRGYDDKATKSGGQDRLTSHGRQFLLRRHQDIGAMLYGSSKEDVTLNISSELGVKEAIKSKNKNRVHYPTKINTFKENVHVWNDTENSYNACEAPEKYPALNDISPLKMYGKGLTKAIKTQFKPDVQNSSLEETSVDSFSCLDTTFTVPSSPCESYRTAYPSKSEVFTEEFSDSCSTVIRSQLLPKLKGVPRKEKQRGKHNNAPLRANSRQTTEVLVANREKLKQKSFKDSAVNTSPSLLRPNITVIPKMKKANNFSNSEDYNDSAVKLPTLIASEIENIKSSENRIISSDKKIESTKNHSETQEHKSENESLPQTVWPKIETDLQDCDDSCKEVPKKELKPLVDSVDYKVISKVNTKEILAKFNSGSELANKVFGKTYSPKKANVGLSDSSTKIELKKIDEDEQTISMPIEINDTSLGDRKAPKPLVDFVECKNESKVDTKKILLQFNSGNEMTSKLYGNTNSPDLTNEHNNRKKYSVEHKGIEKVPIEDFRKHLQENKIDTKDILKNFNAGNSMINAIYGGFDNLDAQERKQNSQEALMPPELAQEVYRSNVPTKDSFLNGNFMQQMPSDYFSSSDVAHCMDSYQNAFSNSKRQEDEFPVLPCENSSLYCSESRPRALVKKYFALESITEDGSENECGMSQMEYPPIQESIDEELRQIDPKSTLTSFNRGNQMVNMIYGRFEDTNVQEIKPESRKVHRTLMDHTNQGNESLYGYNNTDSDVCNYNKIVGSIDYSAFESAKINAESYAAGKGMADILGGSLLHKDTVEPSCKQERVYPENAKSFTERDDNSDSGRNQNANRVSTLPGANWRNLYSSEYKPRPLEEKVEKYAGTDDTFQNEIKVPQAESPALPEQHFSAEMMDNSALQVGQWSVPWADYFLPCNDKALIEKKQKKDTLKYLCNKIDPRSILKGRVSNKRRPIGIVPGLE